MRAILTHTRRHGRSVLFFLIIAIPFVRTASADPPAVESDVVLAAKVSAAIGSQPDLAGLNLTVDVVNRAAEIGGPVPNEAAVPKIEAAARSVPGLLSVRVTGWVTAPADPLKSLVEKELKGPAATPQAAKTTTPAIPTLALVPRADSAPVTARRIPANGHGFLLDPVGAAGTQIETLPLPTIPPPAVPTLPVGVLTATSPIDAAIEKARAADPRFARLTVELRGSTAVITGSTKKSADAWDFADAVRKVPGVERVVVGSVGR